MPERQTPSQRIRPNPVTVTLWALAGALVLALFAALQQLAAGSPPDLPADLRLPTLFGLLAGGLIGLLHARLTATCRTLAEEEARYRGLYQNTPVMLHSINRDGKLVSVSRTWLDKLGYSEKEVIGRPLIEFFSESSRRMAETSILPEFFRKGYVRDIPYQLRRKNGEILEVLLSAVAETDARGEFQRSLAVAVDVTERRRAEATAHRLAYFDMLTGLPNRVLFQDRLAQACAQAQRNQQQLALICLDLDRFKTLNDTLGHAFGDLVLQAVAIRLAGCLPRGDTLARPGGDEFALLIGNAGERPVIEDLVRQVMDALLPSINLQGRELFVSASFGVALFPADAANPEDLLRHTEVAMYASKTAGRNTWTWFSREMTSLVSEKLDLENALRRAVEREELSLVYQPQLDLENGSITGLEALLRWKHPREGVIPPSRFIPIAEETGLIIPIGAWALRTACTQARAWQESGLPLARIAVNITASQLKQPNFTELIDRILEETGLPPRMLELELTESTLMENVPETIAALTDLQVRGIQIAVDDFGTGYSSLVYLKNFPINRLKIAQEFVRDIPADHDHAAIVEAIIAMARSLGLNVLAEGVENREQLDFLHGLRCHEMQGFYFSEPLRVWEVARLYEDGLARPGVCLFREKGLRPS